MCVASFWVHFSIWVLNKPLCIKKIEESLELKGWLVFRLRNSINLFTKVCPQRVQTFCLCLLSGAFSVTVLHVSGKCIYPMSQCSFLFLLIESQKAILDFFLLTFSSGTVPYLIGGLECSRKSQHCSVIKDWWPEILEMSKKCKWN